METTSVLEADIHPFWDSRVRGWLERRGGCRELVGTRYAFCTHSGKPMDKRLALRQLSLKTALIGLEGLTYGKVWQAYHDHYASHHERIWRPFVPE